MSAPEPRYRGAVWAAIAVALGLTLCAYVGATSENLPPCQHEDSTRCYWDADTMGNGMGNDVVNMGEEK